MSNGITSNQRQSTPVKFTYDCTKASPGISPEIVRPFSKEPSQKKMRANNRKSKCTILTDTPEKNPLESQQMEKKNWKRKTTVKQPRGKDGKLEEEQKKQGRLFIRRRCLIWFDSCREGKENKDWIQCIVCKNWFHLNRVNCPHSGSFICQTCDSDDTEQLIKGGKSHNSCSWCLNYMKNAWI